jgi:hypothetical protein
MTTPQRTTHLPVVTNRILAQRRGDKG